MSIKTSALCLMIASLPHLAVAAPRTVSGGYYRGPKLHTINGDRGYFRGHYVGIYGTYRNAGYRPGYYVPSCGRGYHWDVHYYRRCLPNFR